MGSAELSSCRAHSPTGTADNGNGMQTSGVVRIAGLLGLGLLLLLLGQSAWAAGYGPPRSLGAWTLQRLTSTLQLGGSLAPPPDNPRSPADYYDTSDTAKPAEAASAGSKQAGTAAGAPAKSERVAKAQAEPQTPAQQDSSKAAQQQGPEQQQGAHPKADTNEAANSTAVQQVAAEPSVAKEAATPQPTSPKQDEQQQLSAAAASKPAGVVRPSLAAAQQQQQQQQPAAAGQQAPAAADSDNSKVLQGTPYDLDDLPDADALFKAHRNWQTSVLQGKRKGVPAVKVETGQGHGLGNRLPGIGTGFILAVLTGRLFFLQSTVHEHVEFPFPCVWQDFEPLYADVEQCDLGHFTKFVNPDLKFCGGPGENKTAPLLKQPCQFDYMLPMFQINPTLRPYFDKFFPDGEVYSRAARYLFKPKPLLQAALEPYGELSSKCVVGMHLRTRKAGTSAPVELFAAIARAVAVSRPGTVFVAADAADVYARMQERLPGREVWWNKAAAAELQRGNTTTAGNPGTELNAMADLWLLSKCRNVILTPSSSIGGLAAALAGVAPVFANHGPHTEPFTNPWFWKSVTSEPCFVKAALVHRVDTALAQRFRREHPLFVYHSQCHWDSKAVGLPDATWECTAANCREWRRRW